MGAKFDKYVTKNRLGVLMVAIHWLLALTAVWFFQKDKLDQVPSVLIIVSNTTALFLAVFDIIPLTLSLLIAGSLTLFGKNFLLLWALFSLITISFQWLLIGKKIGNFLWRLEPQMQSLGIYDSPKDDLFL